MNRRYLLPYIAVLALAVATVWYLHGAHLPVLEPAGPVAAAELRVMVITTLLCAIVVIPVFVLLFYFAWKYRAGNTATNVDHRPDWDHDNWIAETLWWLVPAAIIACLAVLAWRSSYALDPYKPLDSDAPALTIQVVALDWKWLFIYPEQGIASVNLVEFPADVPVRFELTADAPMNSFWVPSLGGQIMVMPGMQTQLNLMASRVGDYQGASANISGDGFAGMAFTARAVSQDDFSAWVASAQDSARPLTLDAYGALAAPSSYNPVMLYSSADTGLFGTIINRVMMPEQGEFPAAMPAGDMPDMNGMSGMDMRGMDMSMPMHMNTNTAP
ncbi:MAG TPA: COX aromatic rich motif-containing protein [Candidatus Paceibacterota bacterium]